MVGGDVLVVEGHHVQALGELQQGVQVLVVTDRGVGHGGDGGNVFAFGQDTEFEAQGGGGWGHHARKLAAANHADYWKSHMCQPTEKRARLPASAALKRPEFAAYSVPAARSTRAAGAVGAAPGKPG